MHINFCFDSENLAIAKIENFAMIVIFTMIAKFAMIAKFHYHRENLVIAKISL